MVAKMNGEAPDDWKEAATLLGANLNRAREWFKENVETNDRATLWGAPEIFVRRLPSYSAKPFKHWEAA